MNFKSLLDSQMSKISLLKFDKSWNVLQATKYLWFLKVSWIAKRSKNNFSQVWEVLECLASFKICFYYLSSWIAKSSKLTFLMFDKSWNVSKASKYFSMIFKRLLDYQKVQDTFLKFDKSWNVWQASKYFSLIFKRLLDCQKVQDYFSDVWEILECLASFKTFFYDF